VSSNARFWLCRRPTTAIGRLPVAPPRGRRRLSAPGWYRSGHAQQESKLESTPVGALHAGCHRMNLRVVVITVAGSLGVLGAQTQPADCSQRTAEDYVVISRTERLADYIQGLTGGKAYLYSGALAGVDQAIDQPRKWGQGGDGYGLRYGSAFAEHVIDATLTDGLALGLDEDNRYFNSGAHSFGRRLEYALTSPFLARHSDRSRSISVSGIGGAAGASLIQQIWQPGSISAGMTNAGRTFGLTFAFRAGMDVVREFAPRSVGNFLR
jgi:hypothetical protein